MVRISSNNKEYHRKHRNLEMCINNSNSSSSNNNGNNNNKLVWCSKSLHRSIAQAWLARHLATFRGRTCLRNPVTLTINTCSNRHLINNSTKCNKAVYSRNNSSRAYRRRKRK